MRPLTLLPILEQESRGLRFSQDHGAQTLLQGPGPACAKPSASRGRKARGGTHHSYRVSGERAQESPKSQAARLMKPHPWAEAHRRPQRQQDLVGQGRGVFDQQRPARVLQTERRSMWCGRTAELSARAWCPELLPSGYMTHGGYSALR